jgi:hypothetical protein
LGVAHTDWNTKRHGVEAAGQERHRAKPHIYEGDGRQRGRQLAQPCRHLTRSKQLPDNPAALRKPVKDGERQGDPVIEDVLLHPPSKSGSGAGHRERRARSVPPPDVETQAHQRARQQRHDDFRVGAEAPEHHGRRADDEERGGHPRNRAREQALDQHELEADKQGEARQRDALQRDNARTHHGERRRGEINLWNALEALAPQKRRMLTVEHVEGHQALHGLVGVEEPVAVKEKRRPAEDDERRDEKKLESPAAPDSRTIWPDR